MAKTIGHNRAGSVAADQLRSVIDRIESLESEKQSLAADIRDIYAEAKANGLCPKALRHIIKLRKQDANERQEHEQIVDVYLGHLGMLPLFESAEQ